MALTRAIPVLAILLSLVAITTAQAPSPAPSTLPPQMSPTTPPPQMSPSPPLTESPSPSPSPSPASTSLPPSPSAPSPAASDNTVPSSPSNAFIHGTTFFMPFLAAAAILLAA